MTLSPVLERQYPLREAGKWMAASGEPHHVNVGIAVPRAHHKRLLRTRVHTLSLLKGNPMAASVQV